MLFALVALAAPAAASPAEDALFRWADKCPSTAMQAGIYHNAGVEQLSVAEKAVFRVRTRDEGAAGLVTEAVWLVGDGCRAVGLTREAPKGGGPRKIRFVVAKDGGAPRADEQATLLAWAAEVPWAAVPPGAGKGASPAGNALAGQPPAALAGLVVTTAPGAGTTDLAVHDPAGGAAFVFELPGVVACSWGADGALLGAAGGAPVLPTRAILVWLGR